MYLRFLSANDEAYMRYHRWRSKPPPPLLLQSMAKSDSLTLCRVCQHHLRRMHRMRRVDASTGSPNPRHAESFQIQSPVNGQQLYTSDTELILQLAITGNGTFNEIGVYLNGHHVFQV